MIRYVIIMLFFIALSSGHAQVSSSQKDPLAGARSLMKTDPEGAIDLIRNRLNYQRGRHDDTVFINSFILLGDIYFQIEQFELAVDRYDEALGFTSSEMNKERCRILSKKGNALLAFDHDRSKAVFKLCLELSDDMVSRFSCEEGLADVLVRQDSMEDALAKYQKVEQYYIQEKISEDLVRVQSKLSQLFLLKKDVPKARLNFENAYQNNVQSLPTSMEDRVAYDRATEAVISTMDSDLGEIKIRRQNIALKKDDPKYQAVEQIKLADLYVRMDEPKLALNTLSAAEEVLDEINAPSIKSEISKKSSELYVKQGDFQNALKALNTFEREYKLAIAQKERELDKEIAIVKNQQKIDIDDKNFINKSAKVAYERDLGLTQKYIIGLLSLLLFIAAVSIVVILRNIKSKKIANKLLELKGLRAQMNPHFLFNALNTVNEYIVLQDERKANQYLTDFSGLMRMILENSQEDLISIQDEIEVSKKYIELEHQRFQDKFDYELDIANSLPSGLLVPPLLLQPYIENAIWHGLRYKEEKGQLKFIVKNVAEDKVSIEIIDDGVGREKSLAMKTTNQKTYKSTGMQNTGKRMLLINELYDQEITLCVSNLDENLDECGTRVEIQI